MPPYAWPRRRASGNRRTCVAGREAGKQCRASRDQGDQYHGPSPESPTGLGDRADPGSTSGPTPYPGPNCRFGAKLQRAAVPTRQRSHSRVRGVRFLMLCPRPTPGPHHITDRGRDGPGARRSPRHGSRTAPRGPCRKRPWGPTDDNLRALPRPKRPRPTETTSRVLRPQRTEKVRRLPPTRRGRLRYPRGRPPIRTKRLLRCLRTRTTRKGSPRSR